MPGHEVKTFQRKYHHYFGDVHCLPRYQLLDISLSKVNVSSGPVSSHFPGMVNFRLGDFVLSFAGIRNWAEIYRYVMILARFEVGINMAMCYLTRKYF